MSNEKNDYIITLSNPMTIDIFEEVKTSYENEKKRVVDDEEVVKNLLRLYYKYVAGN